MRRLLHLGLGPDYLEIMIRHRTAKQYSLGAVLAKERRSMRSLGITAVCVLFIHPLNLTSSAPSRQATSAPQNNAALTNQDIVLMAKSKFDDNTIVQMIQTHDTNFDLSVAALVTLKDAGVAQSVIQAMLATGPNREVVRPAEHAASSAVARVPPDSQSPREYSAMQLQPGTYYWTEGAWHLMQQLNMSGGGAKHMAKVFVPGLTPQIVWTFREPKAPVQVKESQPVFCVKFFALPSGLPYAPSPRDIAIARFDEKKDHRELQITSGGNMLTFKSGLGKDRLPDLTVTPLDGATVLFTPAVPLHAGEYIVSTTSMGITGYDFGFHPEK
jgi:hypothetical protein